MVKGNSQALRTPSYISKGYVPSEEFPASAQNGVKYTGRFRAGSATAAFAYNDWAIAQIAKGLGYTADYNTFLGRSRNWQNIWNPEQHTSLAWETKDYAGFLMNRKSDGSFVTGANTTGSDKYFYEANMHEGSYTNTYDMATLISLMGGREQYVERLEYAFDKPCYKAPYWNTGSLINFTNEPAFQIPWTFATPEVGRPDLASKWANEFYKKYTDTTYPGDEDNGAMSSMYIFLNSGFMPFSCTNNYYLHGARLPEITYNLAGNKQFTIIGNNTGANNFYVQSATLNGQPLNRSYITYDEIKNGGTLVFNMGSAPSSWAQDPTATTSASSSQAASSTSSTVTSITTTASTPSTAANTGSTRVVYDWEAQNGKTGKGISGLDNGDTSIWNTSFLATAIPNSAPGSTVGLKGTWAVTYSDKTQFHITLPAGWATDTTGLKLWLGTSRASQTAEVRFSNGIQYSLNVTSTGGWYNVNWADKNKTAEDLATATTVSIWFYQTTSGDIAYLDDIIATLSTSNTTLTTITTPTTTSTTTATTTTSMTVPTTTTATTTTTVTTTQSTSLSTALSQQTTTDLTTSDHKYTIPYQTNNGLLWGINHRGNDAAVFRSSFQPQSGIEIRLYDKKGNLNRDGSVGTSTKVQIYENDAQISEYTVILYGDVDSDGKITAIDMLKIKKKLLKMPLTLNEYEAIAADCSVQKDGSIDVFDLLAMKRHLLKIEFINQN
ncbi:MAG: hypothetical protein BGN88_01190 [Clostridiales bacterium 43-6]|nr:MAG: hypothetical protein BGN88_01190 [Clostridiales bacterium 43-6]